MDTANTSSSWLGVALCLALYIAVMSVFAYFGIRSRQRYVQRIQAAQARGAFNDFRTSQVGSRFRRLAIMALVCILGSISSLVVLALSVFGVTLISPQIALVILGGFILLGIIAGLLMQREVTRRL